MYHGTKWKVSQNLIEVLIIGLWIRICCSLSIWSVDCITMLYQATADLCLTWNWWVKHLWVFYWSWCVSWSFLYINLDIAPMIIIKNVFNFVICLLKKYIYTVIMLQIHQYCACLCDTERLAKQMLLWLLILGVLKFSNYNRIELSINFKFNKQNNCLNFYLLDSRIELINYSVWSPHPCRITYLKHINHELRSLDLISDQWVCSTSGQVRHLSQKLAGLQTRLVLVLEALALHSRISHSQFLRKSINKKGRLKSVKFRTRFL